MGPIELLLAKVKNASGMIGIFKIIVRLFNFHSLPQALYPQSFTQSDSTGTDGGPVSVERSTKSDSGVESYKIGLNYCVPFNGHRTQIGY